jgi:dTDP-4-amino-4,6-dideoxygalactose transaminase
MDPADAERKMTPHTRAIIVQHTFGVPAQMDRLVAIARKHKVVLIEDCAHGLGAEYRNVPLGTLGDAAVFSFGRDKVLSSVFGGVGVISDAHPREQKRLRRYQMNLRYPSNGWILMQLAYPLACRIIASTYAFGFGRLLHAVVRDTGLLSRALTEEERFGRRPRTYPAKYPNALAVLLLNQLVKLRRFSERRRRTGVLYRKEIRGRDLTAVPSVRGSAYLRYALFARSPDALRKRARKKGIYLGNWYHNVIDPEDVDLIRASYRRGSCPRAEYAAKHVVNLPTNISSADGMRVVRAL